MGAKHLKNILFNFGNKITGSMINMSAELVCSQVRLCVDRRIDFSTVGGRPPISATYSAAFDPDGRIHAVKAVFDFVFGYVPDWIPFQAEIMCCSAFSAYDVPHVDIGATWQSDRPLLTFTAMRSPGTVEVWSVRISFPNYIP